MGDNVGFWKRAFAFIIDLLIINLVIIYPFRGIFVDRFGKLSFSEAIAAGGQVLPNNIYFTLFIMSVLALLYFTFFDYYLEQSPGQMLLRIKVISTRPKEGSANDAAQGIGFWAALTRNCFILPFFPFYAFWIIEPIYLAVYKERFLEKITLTKTVYEYQHTNYKEYKLSKV